MQFKNNSIETKNKHRIWMFRGFGILIVAVSFALVGTREWIGYSYSAPYLHEVALPNTEHHAYAYASGFQDVSAEYAVEYNDQRYVLSASIGEEYISATLYFSADGQIVAAKTDLEHCRELGLPMDDAGETAEAQYTHAFDFTTGTFIETPDPCGSSKVTRQARDAEILALLNNHGGEGMSYRPTWPPGTDPTMRRMGYWEWKRWAQRVQRARRAH